MAGVEGFPNLQKTCKLMYTPTYTYTSPRPPAAASGGTNTGGSADGSADGNVEGTVGGSAAPATYHTAPLKVGPNSSAPGDNKGILCLYSTPPEAFAEEKEKEMLWLHCLYALKDRNLGVLESNFASNVYNFFVAIDRNWDDLVQTIATGALPAGQFRDIITAQWSIPSITVASKHVRPAGSHAQRKRTKSNRPPLTKHTISPPRPRHRPCAAQHARGQQSPTGSKISVGADVFLFGFVRASTRTEVPHGGASCVQTSKRNRSDRRSFVAARPLHA